MTKEEIAALAAKYINCPEFCLVIWHDGEPFAMSDTAIRALAASCLAQREQPEPSVPVSHLKHLLAEYKSEFVGGALVDLLQATEAAEKEAAK